MFSTSKSNYRAELPPATEYYGKPRLVLRLRLSKYPDRRSAVHEARQRGAAYESVIVSRGWYCFVVFE